MYNKINFPVRTVTIILLILQTPQIKPNMLARSVHYIKETICLLAPKKDNFTTIEPNVLYRTRQLSANELDYYMKKYNIKTVVNLRGKQRKKRWWKQEQKTVLENNGLLFDIRMSAYALTPLEKLKQLADIFITAPTPILIHCKAGVDRTGEAAAFYKLMNGSETKVALKQLSSKFGHSKYAFPNKQKLIKEINTIYPNLLEQIKQQKISQRFTVEDLNGLTATQLHDKVENANKKSNT